MCEPANPLCRPDVLAKNWQTENLLKLPLSYVAVYDTDYKKRKAIVC